METCDGATIDMTLPTNILPLPEPFETTCEGSRPLSDTDIEEYFIDLTDTRIEVVNGINFSMWKIGYRCDYCHHPADDVRYYCTACNKDMCSLCI
jgi:hypothetical protein